MRRLPLLALAVLSLPATLRAAPEPPPEAAPALRALRGMGPASRSAWPELAGFLEQSTALAERKGDLRRRVERRHGWLGASAGDARREARAVAEALDVARLLEARGGPLGASAARLHAWLHEALQAGLAARAARDGGATPRLANCAGDPRPHAELLAGLPASSVRLWGPLDAGEALLLALAVQERAGEAPDPGPLGAELGALLEALGSAVRFRVQGFSERRGAWTGEALFWSAPDGPRVEIAPAGLAPLTLRLEPHPHTPCFLGRGRARRHAGLLGPLEVGAPGEEGELELVLSTPAADGRLAGRWSLRTSEAVESCQETWTPLRPDAPALALLGASRLFQEVAASVREVAGRGTVPAPLLVSGGNAVDPRAYLTGPEIFAAAAEWIAAAEEEVLLQFFTWEPESQASHRLLEALAALGARPRPAGAPPIRVRIAVNQPLLGGGGALIAALREALAGLQLDPSRVDLRLEAHRHKLLGALHTKSVVVDGRRALVTGANVEACHDAGDPWFDAAFRLEGPAVAALRADFLDLWRDVAKERLPSLPVPPPAARPGRAVLLATRRAEGNPFKNDADDPQGRAFLGAIRGARRLVRLHSPNLNDDAIRAALLDALLQHGVRVELVLSRGFNEQSESLPGQGGGNEKNMHALAAELLARGGPAARARLAARWYVAPDGRGLDGNGGGAAHAKYASFDGEVALVGSGNLDTQSLNHSREVNLLVDGADLVAAWDARLFEPSFARGVPLGE